jgi:hypothetical protein
VLLLPGIGHVGCSIAGDVHGFTQVALLHPIYTVGTAVHPRHQHFSTDGWMCFKFFCGGGSE